MNKVEFDTIETIIKTSGVTKILSENMLTGSALIVSDVPPMWQNDFIACGFREYACYCDYWIDRLNLSGNKFNGNDFLLFNECAAASQISLACKGMSRGFEGEARAWFENWLHCEEDGQKAAHCENAAILTKRINKQIVGISCTATYAHESEKGTVVWVRMIAVHPEYQGRGIGKYLLMQTLQYGAAHGAKRAFLHVDTQNIAAIKIYTSARFLAREDEGQTDMIWSENQ